MHNVKTNWVNNMAFDSQIDKHTIRIDAPEPLGEDTGASPKKLLLSSLAGCTGLDVVSLLNKMKVSFNNFEMDVEADLTDEHPKVYSEIRLVYRFFGEDLNKAKIEKAIALSKNKYCGVSAMLQKNCPIVYSVEYFKEA